jgi:hypothetical protein
MELVSRVKPRPVLLKGSSVFMFKLFSLTSAALLCGIALVAQGPGGPGFEHGGPGRFMHFGPPVTGAPYSGAETIQMEQTLSDGNKIDKTEQSKIYRDSQGRVRTESTHTSPEGTSETAVAIFDPVAGFMVRLNTEKLTAVKHTLPAAGSMPAGTPHHHEGANAPQVQKEDLGSKTINGLVATGTRVTMTIPAGEFGNAQAIVTVRETWVSTALKVPVLETSSNPERGNSTRQLIVTSQTEPDAALFQIPSTYTVKTQAGPPDGRGHGGPPPAE